MTFENELRRQLRDLAEQGGPTDRLRADVRTRLEALDEGIAILDTTPPAPRRARWVLSAAAVTLALSFGVVAAVSWLAAERDRELVTEQVPSEPTTETTAAEPPADDGSIERSVSSTDPAFALAVVTDGAVATREATATSRLWGFEVWGDSLPDPGQIVFAVPETADDITVDAHAAVVDLLLENLAQVELVDVTDAMLADVPSTRVRLRSSRDMTLVGFRIGTQTFVTASGVDREFEIHLLDRPDGGVLAVLMDARVGQIGLVRDVATRMVRSLEWVD